MTARCVGCGSTWYGMDRKAALFMVNTEDGCPICGAHIVVVEDYAGNEEILVHRMWGVLSDARYTRRPPPLEWFVGVSGHTSALKEQIIEDLREKGIKWSWESGEPSPSTLALARRMWEEGIPPHPVLQSLLKNKVGKERGVQA